MVRRWLVTGGCGFIGSSLVDHIIRHFPDDKVRVFDNLSVGTEEDLQQITEYRRVQQDTDGGIPTLSHRYQLLVGDVRNRDLCLAAGRNIDIIVHLAANTGVGPSVDNPGLDCEINVLGTLNMLEAARLNNVGRFVFASSGAPVGEVTPPIHEEKVPRPVSPYGASKLAGEAYCSAYHKTFGVDTVALRFGNVYGGRSRHKSSVVAKFIKQALAGECLYVYGDGNQTRDFIYIDDLVDAIQKASLVTGVGGEIFQIATSRESSVNELLDVLTGVLSKKGVRQIDVKHIAPRTGDVYRNYSDTSKAQKYLGWSAGIEIETGLSKTVDWWKNNR